ncbi:helix-turn-helix domain-containing protein [Clostridium culturomicium]|uniref:helix-turn-helix domain-containing protein n=1 Tax=Clostridium culturomicium TaxID=1499683 RepID=UPI0006933494|nr:helix-turn-helix transcriptional regulator [Clostridium culturomicium]
MLGDTIRKIRKSKKVSINKLAQSTSISLGYLSDLENNKAQNPSLEKLNAIADALGVSVNDFFEDTINEKVTNKSELTTKEKFDIEKEAQKMIDNIDKLDTVEFCGTPADEDDKEYLKLAYEKFLTDVRIYNKQKYTPKKYRDK